MESLDIVSYHLHIIRINYARIIIFFRLLGYVFFLFSLVFIKINIFFLSYALILLVRYGLDIAFETLFLLYPVLKLKVLNALPVPLSVAIIMLENKAHALLILDSLLFTLAFTYTFLCVVFYAAGESLFTVIDIFKNLYNTLSSAFQFLLSCCQWMTDCAAASFVCFKVCAFKIKKSRKCVANNDLIEHNHRHWHRHRHTHMHAAIKIKKIKNNNKQKKKEEMEKNEKMTMKTQ